MGVGVETVTTPDVSGTLRFSVTPNPWNRWPGVCNEPRIFYEFIYKFIKNFSLDVNGTLTTGDNDNKTPYGKERDTYQGRSPDPELFPHSGGRRSVTTDEVENNVLTPV